MGNSSKCCSNEYGRRRSKTTPAGSYSPLARNCYTREKTLEHCKTGSGFSPAPAEQDDRSIPEASPIQPRRLDLTADTENATHEGAAWDSLNSKLQFALELANDASLKLARAKEEALNSPGTLVHLNIDQEIDKLDAVKGKLDELRVVEQRRKDWLVENAAAGKGKIGRLEDIPDTEIENSVLGGVADCNAAAAAAYKIALLAAQANTVAAEAETCTDMAIKTDALALETAQLALLSEPGFRWTPGGSTQA